MSNDPEKKLADDIPVEAIVGIIITTKAGHMTPRWLAMNDRNKRKYLRIGEKFLSRFRDEELMAKRARDSGEEWCQFKKDLK